MKHRFRCITLNLPYDVYTRANELRQEYAKALKTWPAEEDFYLYVLSKGFPAIEQELRGLIAPSIITPYDSLSSPPRP